MHALSSEMDCTQLQQQLAYTFKDVQLLVAALTHGSFANEHQGVRQTYQRLEFVGDAVLGLMCAEQLFVEMPLATEGELSRRRARVVRRESLSQLAQLWQLQAYIRVGSGQSAQKHLSASVMADVFEAVVGAMYIDGGLDVVRRVVLPCLRDAIAKTQAPQDFKTMLQELAYPRQLGVPRYDVERIDGPSHAQVFTCRVYLNEQIYGRGQGTSKKAAEQVCAQQALAALGIGRDDP